MSDIIIHGLQNLLQEKLNLYTKMITIVSADAYSKLH